MTLGFSTGSIAKGDFKKALQILDAFPNLTAVELSALREEELPELVKELPILNLHQYTYVSVHAPSKLKVFTEQEIINLLLQITAVNIHVIVHPDIITDFSGWHRLGRFLCIENMDKRKTVGRTAEDLDRLFQLLPEARFCLDLAHAKQVDPSMVECVKMLRGFSDRLVQFHISDVTSDSYHVPINIEAILAYRKVEQLIPRTIPFIIESQVEEPYIAHELRYISSIFHIHPHNSPFKHPFVSDSDSPYHSAVLKR